MCLLELAYCLRFWFCNGPRGANGIHDLCSPRKGGRSVATTVTIHDLQPCCILGNNTCLLRCCSTERWAVPQDNNLIISIYDFYYSVEMVGRYSVVHVVQESCGIHT